MTLGKYDLTIGQIIKAYPETREVFIYNGFPVFADDAILKQLGPILKLKTALNSRNINHKAFIGLLEEKIAETGHVRQLQATLFDSNAGHLNILTFLPCPLKVPVQEEVKRFLEYMRQEKALPLNYCVEAFSNNEPNFDNYIQYFEDPDEVPDVLITAGYNFFYKKFVDRFVKKGVFTCIPGQAVNQQLAQAGIVDSDGHFTVIAVNVLVMVVDTKRLGGLPIPKKWSDLLNPVYEKKVVMRGQGDMFCDIVQLNFYKDYGESGLMGLGRAVKYGLHPAQMVKELASSRTDVPPIHIMPRFFAQTITDCRTEIIWPEDGALAFPVSVLIKTDKMAELKELADFIVGPHIARICSDAFFPAVHPVAGGNLPAGAKFKWLGWDYIKNHDMETLREELNTKFLQAQQGGGGPLCS